MDFQEHLDEAIRLIENKDWESAYEKLEWASLIQPENPITYLMKSVILVDKFWEQRRLYEKYSGKKFSSWLD